MGILGKLFGSKESTRQQAVKRAMPAVAQIINDYADILEHRSPFPLSVADENKLPWPKTVIKKAIIIALTAETDPQKRSYLMTGYVTLAYWQPNVGDKNQGFDRSKKTTTGDIDKALKEIISQAEQFKQWANVIESEMDKLSAELKQLGFEYKETLEDKANYLLVTASLKAETFRLESLNSKEPFLQGQANSDWPFYITVASVYVALWGFVLSKPSESERRRVSAIVLQKLRSGDPRFLQAFFDCTDYMKVCDDLWRKRQEAADRVNTISIIIGNYVASKTIGDTPAAPNDDGPTFALGKMVLENFLDWFVKR
jgi:hypothetical protein